jgi:hypothetical protein
MWKWTLRRRHLSKAQPEHGDLLVAVPEEPGAADRRLGEREGGQPVRRGHARRSRRR